MRRNQQQNDREDRVEGQEKTNVFSNHYKCNDPPMFVQKEGIKKQHDKQRASSSTPTAITGERTNGRASDASVSSFFIKFHHGCPILIVFICWEMFVNVISFNAGGTFLASTHTDKRWVGRVGSLIQRRKTTFIMHSLCVFCTFAFEFKILYLYTSSFSYSLKACLHLRTTPAARTH